MDIWCNLPSAVLGVGAIVVGYYAMMMNIGGCAVRDYGPLLATRKSFVWAVLSTVVGELVALSIVHFC